MTVHEALRFGAKKLREHRCAGSSPLREAEELLGSIIHLSRETLFTHPEHTLTAQQLSKFKNALVRRLRHEPIEYITGTAHFMGLALRVTRDTLIPRQATEILVEAALACVAQMPQPLFLDIGTGSGCIAAAIASRRPDARVVAIDTSSAALRIAKKNARALNLTNRVRFVKADLLPRKLPPAKTTVAVANLPYIPAAAMRRLPKEIARYEPKNALHGGTDGLDLYRALLLRLSKAHKIGALFVFFEILPSQYQPLTKIVHEYFPCMHVARIKNRGVTIALRGAEEPLENSVSKIR